MNSDELTCREATRDDLSSVAAVFTAAFPESVAHVAGTLPNTDVLADLFALALDAEPGCLLVAEAEGRIAGYVLAPARTSRLRSVFLWRGRWVPMLGRWLAGMYGVRLRALRIALADKMAFLRFSRQYGGCEARILSIAVHPNFQGRGVGRRLLEVGLQHLKAQGVPQVRLEVRPGNAPARHLYADFGFREIGTYADAQGPWLVMTADLQEAAHAAAGS